MGSHFMHPWFFPRYIFNSGQEECTPAPQVRIAFTEVDGAFPQVVVTLEYLDATAVCSLTELDARGGRGLVWQSLCSVVMPSVTPGKGRALDKSPLNIYEWIKQAWGNSYLFSSQQRQASADKSVMWLWTLTLGGLSFHNPEFIQNIPRVSSEQVFRMAHANPISFAAVEEWMGQKLFS